MRTRGPPRDRHAWPRRAPPQVRELRERAEEEKRVTLEQARAAVQMSAVQQAEQLDNLLTELAELRAENIRLAAEMEARTRDLTEIASVVYASSGQSGGESTDRYGDAGAGSGEAGPAAAGGKAGDDVWAGVAGADSPEGAEAAAPTEIPAPAEGGDPSDAPEGGAEGGDPSDAPEGGQTPDSGSGAEPRWLASAEQALHAAVGGRASPAAAPPGGSKEAEQALKAVLGERAAPALPSGGADGASVVSSPSVATSSVAPTTLDLD